MRYQFLEFTVDTEQQALIGPTGTLPLRRQSYRVLKVLMDRAPGVVSKDELLDAVWGHQAVSATAVAQTIRELREALNDDATRPRVILTKHRMGYQFIAPLTSESPVSAVPQAGTTRPAIPELVADRMARRHRHPAFNVLGMVALFLAGLALWRTIHDPEHSESRISSFQAERAVAEGMAATRVLDAAAAATVLGRARSAQDNPRLALLHARQLLLLGERLDVDGILDSIDVRVSDNARFDDLFHSAVREEAAGRFAAALDSYESLYRLAPENLDVALILFETQVIERRKSAHRTFESIVRNDELPHARRLLLSAQLAGIQRDAERQLQQSMAAIAASDASWTGLIGSAEVEQANALMTLGRIDEALDAYSRAASTLESAGLLRAAADARLLRIEPAIARGDLPSAAAGLDALSRRMREVGDSYTVGRILHAQGRIALRSGNDEDAVAFFSAAAEQHELGGNPDGVVSAYGAQSGPLRRLGRRDQAAELLQRALLIAERSSLASARANIFGNLGNLLAEDGRLDEAERHFEAALSLYRSLRNRRWEAVVLGSLAGVAQIRGALRTAEERYRQALEVFLELDAPLDIARTHHSLAEIALAEGDLGTAARHIDAAMERLNTLGHGPRTAHAQLVRAEILLLQADLAGAESLLDAAIEAGNGDLSTVAAVDTLRGRIALLHDDADAARSAFASALAVNERTGRRSESHAAALGLARAQLAVGQFAVVEQETSALVSGARADGRRRDEIAARLVRLQALVAQGRTTEAERETETTRALIDASPVFELEVEWTLLRSRLDLDPQDRRQRLRWALERSKKYGQHLLALGIQVHLLNDLSADERAKWHDEVERRGLRALSRARLAVLR